MSSNQFTANKTGYVICTVIFMGLWVSLSFFVLKESQYEFKTLLLEIESLKQKLNMSQGNKSDTNHGKQRTNYGESDKPELRFQTFKLRDFKKNGDNLVANRDGIIGIIMPVQGFR